MDTKSDRIQSVLMYARQNLRSSLSVERLAEVAHLSPRQFSRAFQAATGRSPAQAFESLRAEAARVMLEQGHDSIDDVARENGFTSRDHMRRAFLRAYGAPCAGKLTSETPIWNRECSIVFISGKRAQAH
jgi:transcriptional regulator GlxA family with amidase domain